MLASVTGSTDSEAGEPKFVFATTHWSVIRAARFEDSAVAQAALEKLCQTYWYPLYAFARRLGLSSHDAEDSVQGFFAACLEKSYFDAADEAKGRFRSFLLLAYKRFLAKEREKARTRKRGGAHPVVALDAFSAEERYALEPSVKLSPDKLFERRWAMTLLEQVLGRLRQEHVAAGQMERFEELKEFLQEGGRGTSHIELATRLNLSESAIKVAVHRLRRRYRELLEEEIAQTVASPEEVEEERRHLLSVLRQPV